MKKDMPMASTDIRTNQVGIEGRNDTTAVKNFKIYCPETQLILWKPQERLNTKLHGAGMCYFFLCNLYEMLCKLKVQIQIQLIHYFNQILTLGILLAGKSVIIYSSEAFFVNSLRIL